MYINVMKRKFYIALSATLIAAVVCIATNFIPYFQGGKLADFLRGCSFGFAAGGAIVTLAWGAKWKQEKSAQAVIQ